MWEAGRRTYRARPGVSTKTGRSHGKRPVVGPADSRYAISGGRAVRPGVLALSAQVKGNSVGSVWEPRLLVLREDGENEVALPLAPGLPELEPGGGLGLVTLTGGQRIMYGATIGHVASYFARIDIATPLSEQEPSNERDPQYFFRFGFTL